MQVNFRVFIYVVALCISQPAFALNTITVMADHSLSIAMTEIARNYSRQAGVIVNTSFLPQKTQQAQIAEGAAADVLITPNMVWMDDLKTQGLLDFKSQFLFAHNRLALVGPLDTAIKPAASGSFPVVSIIQAIQANGGEPSFLVGNPESLMEGVYGKEALRNLNVADDLGEYTLYVKRLDQMFEMMAHQQAYGVVFYSTAIGRNDIKIIDMLPESSHKPIAYYAAAVAGDNMDEARKFLDYLRTRSVRLVLENNGFTIH